MQSPTNLDALVLKRADLLNRRKAIQPEIELLSILPINAFDSLGITLRNIEIDLIDCMLESNLAELRIEFLTIEKEAARSVQERAAMQSP